MHNLKYGNIVLSYNLLTQVMLQIMMEAKTNRRIGGATIVLVFILVLAGFLPAKILAQGPSQEQFLETVGPYEIGVTAVPSTLSLGRVQFIVTVLNSATRQSVPDATVTLRVKHGDDKLDAAKGEG